MPPPFTPLYRYIGTWSDGYFRANVISRTGLHEYTTTRLRIVNPGSTPLAAWVDFWSQSGVWLSAMQLSGPIAARSELGGPIMFTPQPPDPGTPSFWWEEQGWFEIWTTGRVHCEAHTEWWRLVGNESLHSEYHVPVCEDGLWVPAPPQALPATYPPTPPLPPVNPSPGPQPVPGGASPSTAMAPPLHEARPLDVPLVVRALGGVSPTWARRLAVRLYRGRADQIAESVPRLSNPPRDMPRSSDR